MKSSFDLARAIARPHPLGRTSLRPAPTRHPLGIPAHRRRLSPHPHPEGWLHIYHGKGPDAGYSLFALLLDGEEPWRVLRRGDTPLLSPERPCEIDGFFGRVVFTNGLVQRNDRLLIYYGAGDETVCLAEIPVAEIFS